MTIILSSFRARLQAAERELAVEAVTVADGSINQAARLTGLHRSQLRRILQRHGLVSLLRSHASHAGMATGGNAAWRAL